MTEGRVARAHLLVVDDDRRIRSMLARYFEGEGYRVSLAENGAQLRRSLAAGTIDLILLDLGLPDEDGLALARDVRTQSDIGIIIVTGRADDVDRIVGLEVGADDYIVKPFNLRETLARVKSVLRRTRPAERPARAGAKADHQVLSFDGWTLDLDRRQLSAPSGDEVTLTTGEFDLLCTFAENAGRVLTRNFLLDYTRGRSWEAFDRTIDAQVSRLRRKVEDDPSNPARIKSVRGIGYVFTARIGQR
jgi:DNA-binding response OmpR family regulator